MLDPLKSSDFTPFLHQPFCIHLDGIEPIQLEMVSVIESDQGANPGVRRSFSIHFLGPASSQYLIQHIYRLEHDQMGVLDLFLVPLGPQEGRMRYEAIFN